MAVITVLAEPLEPLPASPPLRSAVQPSFAAPYRLPSRSPSRPQLVRSILSPHLPPATPIFDHNRIKKPLATLFELSSHSLPVDQGSPIHHSASSPPANIRRSSYEDLRIAYEDTSLDPGISSSSDHLPVPRRLFDEFLATQDPEALSALEMPPGHMSEPGLASAMKVSASPLAMSNLITGTPLRGPIPFSRALAPSPSLIHQTNNHYIHSCPDTIFDQHTPPKASNGVVSSPHSSPRHGLRKALQKPAGTPDWTIFHDPDGSLDPSTLTRQPPLASGTTSKTISQPFASSRSKLGPPPHAFSFPGSPDESEVEGDDHDEAGRDSPAPTWLENQENIQPVRGCPTAAFSFQLLVESGTIQPVDERTDASVSVGSEERMELDPPRSSIPHSRLDDPSMLNDLVDIESELEVAPIKSHRGRGVRIGLPPLPLSARELVDLEIESSDSEAESGQINKRRKI